MKENIGFNVHINIHMAVNTFDVDVCQQQVFSQADYGK